MSAKRPAEQTIDEKTFEYVSPAAAAAKTDKNSAERV